MKKGILISLLLAGFSFGAIAQDAKPNHKQRPPHENRGERMGGRFTAEERAEIYAKRMQKNLNLTDEQYKKVLALNMEQAKKQEALRAAHKAEMQASREKMKSEHQEMSKKYESVLTPEQFKKFKEEQEIRKSEMQERRKGRKGRK
jgi:Spy/CpxP family protein refolding chaperone